MKEIFSYFLKLGTTGFGGPIALIGMMEQHWVREKKTVSEHDFHQYVTAAKLFPGTTAPLVAIRIGYQLQGKVGGALAGLCLILPAFFMILAISHFMVNAKNSINSSFSEVLTGLNYGGLALSIVAAIRYARPLISIQTLFYMVTTGVLTFLYPNKEIYFLLACGTLSLISYRYKNIVFEASSAILTLLFFESLKACMFTFGSGIAIVPVLKSIYIDQYHWVTESEFLTALGFGQMTPGPLVIMNTYLAHQVASLPGAIAATAGTFLPTFFFGLVAMPYFEKKILNAPILKAFFNGMLPAVGGAILGSVLRLFLFASKDKSGTFSWNQVVIITFLVVFGLKSKFHPVTVLIFGSILVVLGSLVGIIQ